MQKFLIIKKRAKEDAKFEKEFKANFTLKR